MLDFLRPPSSSYEPPPLAYTILTQPIKTLVRLLDLSFSILRTQPRCRSPPVRIVCISDTHTHRTSVPEGDLLIHAGDLTNAGTPAEIQAQIDWLDSLGFEHVVAIAGNHDTWLDPRSRATLSAQDQAGSLDWRGIRYLQHNSTVLAFRNGRRLNVYGAPQIPHDGKHREFAFQYPPGRDAWSGTIPKDTEVLVTHTPPRWHLDLPVGLGCEYLLAESHKVRPLVHVFGHIHAGKTDLVGFLKGGRDVVHWDAAQQSLETALRRPDGLVRGLLDPRSWFDVIRVIIYGTKGVLWDRIWGGEVRATTMILASLMYNSTGKLGHSAQVVDV